MDASPDVSALPSSASATPDHRNAPQSRRGLIFAAYVLVLTAAFGRSLISLFTSALENDLNSYIVLIPLITIYFLYSDRARFHVDVKPAVGWALLPLLAGSIALIFLASGFGLTHQLSNNDRLSVITFAFVCFLWTGGFLFMGRKWMATAAFPMLFLVFLAPLPDRIVDSMETGLRLANLFFALTRTPTVQSGTILQLPGITLEVAQECSGIRSSWVLFITSVIAAKLFLSKPWTRIVLIAAVIPLGILRNGFRIMVIGLLCVHVDPDMIHSIIHRRGGPIFFALSLIPLLLILWLLRRQQTGSRLVSSGRADTAIATR
jgi:exosortase C (VPDSG-CTERM-specific)